jgi:hypothetical protein
MEPMERILRRYQKLPPAGTKRKVPEPSTAPPLSSLLDSNGRRQVFAQLSRAVIASTEEMIRHADKILAK